MMLTRGDYIYCKTKSIDLIYIFFFILLVKTRLAFVVNASDTECVVVWAEVGLVVD